jgi:hypothetical protein
MNTEQENFDRLLRLLKLKRYEQPPPRYFNEFSSRVIARIEAGGEEARGNMFENLFMEAPWLQRLFSAFETKPAVAWMFGLAVCALVVSGIVYSETVDYPQVSMLPGQSVLPLSIETARAQEEAISAPPISLRPPLSESVLALTSDTNSFVPRAGSLFDLIQSTAQPASLTLGGE